ncbi:MAG: hypothetical protein LCH88_22010 [Proteobacteria bacterium]|nr:hypothetical protein [Pseudomonadota bacterium]
MRREIFLALTIACAQIASARSDTLYRCELLDSAHVNEAGRFERIATYENMRAQMNPVLVDTSTGVVRVGRPATIWRWRVFQRGNSDMYWYLGRPDADPQALVVSYLRITPWTSPPLIFLSTSTATFSGQCVVE